MSDSYELTKDQVLRAYKQAREIVKIKLPYQPQREWVLGGFDIFYDDKGKIRVSGWRLDKETGHRPVQIGSERLFFFLEKGLENDRR